MYFVNDLINLFSNYPKNNQHTIPTQLIIYDYMYTKCYDCNLLLNNELNDNENKIIIKCIENTETYKCEGCDIYRCKFHHFVNTAKTRCVECQFKKYRMYPLFYNQLYTCIFCNNPALIGYVDNIILCEKCHCRDKNKYVNIINFSDWCDVKINNNRCCGTGWYRNNIGSFCIKHKNNDSTYNYFIKKFFYN